MNATAMRRPRRVYYILAGLLLSPLPAGVPAQTLRTVDPAMTKGPAAAPVTIVEFSDYQ